MEEVLAITLEVAETLDRLRVPYLVGGSLASSLHGIPRATQDVDIVASLRAEHVLPLVAALEISFYLDADAVREAVERQASFNVIHLETMFKVDVFVTRDDPVSREEMQRRQSYSLPAFPDRALMVASPEDIIVQKLYWFQLGDEVSERQWSDALGVLKVRGQHLDMEYLQQVASVLSVEDLLRRACADVGLPWKAPES